MHVSMLVIGEGCGMLATKHASNERASHLDHSAYSMDLSQYFRNRHETS